jgi:hypothetical protein
MTKSAAHLALEAAIPEWEERVAGGADPGGALGVLGSHLRDLLTELETARRLVDCGAGDEPVCALGGGSACRLYYGKAMLTWSRMYVELKEKQAIQELALQRLQPWLSSHHPDMAPLVDEALWFRSNREEGIHDG